MNVIAKIFNARNRYMLQMPIMAMALIVSFILPVEALASSNQPVGLAARPVNATCALPTRLELSGDLTVRRMFHNIAQVRPIELIPSPNGQEWFLGVQGGEVYRFPNVDTTTDQQTVLDIGPRLVFTSEDTSGPGTDSQQWGLSGIALHPDFSNNGIIFVAYNAKPSAEEAVFSYVSSFVIDSVTGIADLASESVYLTLEQRHVYHHFGEILFGPDGYLYIASGDSGLTPNLSALEDELSQDPFSLYGAILRIDVGANGVYTIPPDNPFATSGLGAPEVYAYGFRNPWRFSIDSVTGELYAGEVGWRNWEEVNKVLPGKNYGWPIMEGLECTVSGCDTAGLELPFHTYSHDDGRAVIGGHVYRGSLLPELVGSYIFGDYSNAHLWALKSLPSGSTQLVQLDGLVTPATGFGEGVNGELYALNVGWRNRIWRLESGDTSSNDSSFPDLLSETGCTDPQNPLAPAEGLIPFSVASPLWSDGADKERWAALPDEATISIDDAGDFEFPIGTVLVKQFAFDGAPVETRLFVRHDDGDWGGYTYEWRNDLSDADLVLGGKEKVLDNGQNWTYPSENQCFQCHTNIAGFALGPEVAQLNHMLGYEQSGIHANQLATWDHIGFFDIPLGQETADLPALAKPSDIGTSVIRRARAYLHSNCSSCHRPDGPAQAAIDLRYSTPVLQMNVCNEDPEQGNAGVPGAMILMPGNPALSMISIRMNRRDGFQMPPLGTHIADSDGVALIDSWITHPDVCSASGDLDLDEIPDNVDNCQLIKNIAQRDTDGDGYGNICDSDFNNDCFVNLLDLAEMKVGFGGSDAELDLNSDGSVNPIDLGLFKIAFGGNPGPSPVGSPCNP